MSRSSLTVTTLSMFRRSLFCVAVLTASLGASCEKTPSPPPPPKVVEPPFVPEVLAWVLPYDNSIQSFERNARYITIASPTYFRLAVDGKNAKLEDWDPGAPFPRPKLMAALKGATPAILPLVGCIGPCGPKISRVIDDEAARKAHVADLIRVTREQGLTGLVIDYEDVDANEANVSRFVDELSTGLRAAGKRLVLVVQEPCGVDPTCKRTPYPFALKSLVKKVDLLAIMEYDFVVDGTGAPAPRAWVEKGLKKVQAEIGADGPDMRKVVCALPFYGRVTKGIADDTAVLFDEVRPGVIRNAKVTIGPLALDANALSKVATVTGGSGATKSGTLYLEDKETIAARIAMLSQFKMGGVAIWRLGGEDPCITSELAKLRQMPVPVCPARGGVPSASSSAGTAPQ
jgi:spore germination protein